MTMQHERTFHYHHEHEQILQFLADFDAALTMAASKGDETRREGLAKLRAMEPQLAEIREHCAEEEQSLESPFRLYLEQNVLETLRGQHQELDELSLNFSSELEVLTKPPETGPIVRSGRNLADRLVQHLGYEESLLQEIEKRADAEESIYVRYTEPGE
jgi:Hemerythrin HHE cation binding domain